MKNAGNRVLTARQRVVTTAGRLFYSQGYNSTGINQVIDEAGIAKKSLYNNFKSKTDLLHTYLEEQHTNWFSALKTFLTHRKTAKERLIGIFEYRMQRQVLLDFGGCPFVKASAEVNAEDKGTYKIVNKNKNKLREYILSQVKQLDPKRSSFSPEMLAETLFLLMEGATVTASFQKKKKAMEHSKLIAEKLLK